MHQWGIWGYDEISLRYTLLNLSNGIFDNKQNESTITIDFEQLRRTTGYRPTENRYKSTAALTASTKIKICDIKFFGRYGILLSETSKFSADPFVVICATFAKLVYNVFINRVQIQVQWVPHTENLLQFMERAVVQPLIIYEGPKHFDSLPD
jgi:hypothetical protein